MSGNSLGSPVAAARQKLQAVAPRAHVPYSKTNEAVLLLFDDGQWIPGVRVESASFSLSLSALANAYTTAATLGRDARIVAVVASHSLRTEEEQYVELLPLSLSKRAPDLHVHTSIDTEMALPLPTAAASPYLDASISSPSQGVALARDVAGRAVVPISDFTVGAVLETNQGQLIPGANVEHSDWARIVCAERNALGTWRSYDGSSVQALYLSCPLDPQGTPCGACRQWLAELAPEITIWMDRGDASPLATSPGDLLPGSFTGEALPHSGPTPDDATS